MKTKIIVSRGERTPLMISKDVYKMVKDAKPEGISIQAYASLLLSQAIEGDRASA